MWKESKPTRNVPPDALNVPQCSISTAMTTTKYTTREHCRLFPITKVNLKKFASDKKRSAGCKKYSVVFRFNGYDNYK